MEEFVQGIPQPDDVWALTLNAVFGPGIVLTAFLLFTLVTAWLGTIRSTMTLARRLGGVARDAGVRLVEMSATEIAAAVGLSALLMVVLCGWLLGVLVIGNLISLAYAGSGHEFLELQTRDAASLVDWLQRTSFTKTYVIAALSVFEVILGFFSWMATGKYTVGVGFTWHLVFAGIIAVYLGSCLIALRAGGILGRLWLARR